MNDEVNERIIVRIGRPNCRPQGFGEETGRYRDRWNLYQRGRVINKLLLQDKNGVRWVLGLEVGI